MEYVIELNKLNKLNQHPRRFKDDRYITPEKYFKFIVCESEANIHLDLPGE